MTYILDASALLPLLGDLGEQLIVKVAEIRLFTLDLTIYEASNTMWKLSTLLKIISPEDAVKTIGILRDVAIKGIIRTIEFSVLDLTRALKVASEQGITYYDSSYIISAEGKAATLVTEDMKLAKAANKYVDTITYTDFRKIV